MTKEELKEFLEKKYKDVGICAYCGKKLRPTKSVDRLGKIVIFPPSLRNNISEKRNEIPMHFTCIEDIIWELNQYNGGEDNEKYSKYIIRY